MSDPAREALGALVEQFDERSAFVRELVQNSLDAGAGRIDLNIEQQGRRLRVAVIDDGEGMDRRIIEQDLLTLFRSSKEDDQTKIGKFGVGFVSLFAVDPELVVVDTSRDGHHHRVVFDQDRRYTLALVDEPFEGTQVVLYVRTWGTKAAELAQELRDALHRWCRFARAELWCEGRGEGWSWGPEEVQHPFSVQAPIVHHHEEDGFRVAMGFTGSASSFVGYYNRGLTLLEASEDVLPGVTFRVEARELEHTLTRDNVRRDGGHAAVLHRLRQLAAGPLLQAHLEALRQAMAADDLELHQRLLGALLLQDLDGGLPLLRTAEGGWLPIHRVRTGLLGRRPVLTALRRDALVDALASQEPVLLGPGTRAEFALLRRVNPRLVLVDAHASWLHVQLADHRLGLYLQRLGERTPGVGAVHLAHLCGAGSERLALRVPRGSGLIEPSDIGRGELVLNLGHPLFRRAAALHPELAAPVLLGAALRTLEAAGPLPGELVDALAEGLS
jgi:hypothetical protein